MHWLDPDYLPQTAGTIARFLINPHGEIDGLLLKNGAEVHIPPHLSAAIGKAVAIGDRIKVRGVRARGSDVLASVSLETAGGNRIVDNGPHDDHEEARADARARAEDNSELGTAEGIVERLIHGAKGEVRGVLLKDGTAVRFPKDKADQIKSLLKSGGKFSARGKQLFTSFGNVLNAHEVGSSQKTLKHLGHKKSKHGKPHDREGAS